MKSFQSPAKLRRRAFGQLWTLAVQFVLGMILNLLSQEANPIAYDVVLALHILTAIGIIEGAVFILLKDGSRLAWQAALAAALAFAAGILTELTGHDYWSFIMAMGFLFAAWWYGQLYVRADRNSQS